MMPRPAMTFSAFAAPKPGMERMKVDTFMRPTTESSTRSIASAGDIRPFFRSAPTAARLLRLFQRGLALLGREFVEAHSNISNCLYFMLPSADARLSGSHGFFASCLRGYNT